MGFFMRRVGLALLVFFFSLSKSPTHCFGKDQNLSGDKWRRGFYFYADFLGSVSSYIVRDVNNANISNSGGLFSNSDSLGGATALSLGIGADILEHFSIEIEAFGRWIFQDQKFTIGNQDYQANNLQLVGAIFKPSITFAEGDFKIFALVGAGAMFFLAKNDNAANNVNSISFVLTYGIGFSGRISSHVGFFLRFFGIAPIQDLVYIQENSIALDGYAIDFGITLRT